MSTDLKNPVEASTIVSKKEAGKILRVWMLLKRNRYILPQSIGKVNRFSEFPLIVTDKFSSKCLSPRAPTIHQKFTLQTPRNML